MLLLRMSVSMYRRRSKVTRFYVGKTACRGKKKSDRLKKEAWIHSKPVIFVTAWMCDDDASPSPNQLWRGVVGWAGRQLVSDQRGERKAIHSP